MFNSQKNNSETDNTRSNNSSKKNHNLSTVNMVSEGTQIIGTLKTKSDIRIAGAVDGEAKVDGKIIITSTGHVDGNVDAEDADIAGRVEGEVHVANKLILHQSSVVEGDLYAQSLIVEEGATFNGTCHMRDYAAENKRTDEESVDADDSEDTVAA